MFLYFSAYREVEDDDENEIEELENMYDDINDSKIIVLNLIQSMNKVKLLFEYNHATLFLFTMLHNHLL